MTLQLAGSETAEEDFFTVQPLTEGHAVMVIHGRKDAPR